MNADRYDISVIIPVYNCADFLPEAIESVLAQTCPPAEIIVVDDGSMDGSAEVAARYAPRVRVLAQPNGGAGSARNLGVRNAGRPLLAFLDADDVWLPDKLQRQMSAMETGEYDMVFGRVEVFRDETIGGDDGRAPQVYEGMHVGAMLIRREAFDRVGEFPTNVRIGEFIDWYARAQDCGLRPLSLPETMVRRRLHHHNLTRGQEDTRAAYFDVLREALRRRQEKTVESE